MSQDKSQHQTHNQVRIGVGAVVFRGHDLLLIKRGKPPFLGKWSIPGGGLEYGERLEDAALREVREETGCEARIVGLIDVFEALPQIDDKASFPHTVMVDYIAEWVSGEPRAGDDAADAEFVPLIEALSRVSWDQTRRALELAVKIRGMSD